MKIKNFFLSILMSTISIFGATSCGTKVSPASSVLTLLKEKGLTLGSAESLTAGLFGSAMCSASGASAVYKGGIISYSNEVKINLLGVSEEDINTYGVVSEEVAKEMALGGLLALDVSVCVSFTGNAGPTAEPGEAQVGEVYMALAYKANNDISTVVTPYHNIFSGERNEIREAVVNYMLNELLTYFKE